MLFLGRVGVPRFGLWCGEDNMVVKYKSDDLDLPGSIDPKFFDELARLVGIPADHDNQEPVRTALPADTERRVRMATVLAVCILGPATRYDGLRGTAQGNFFVHSRSHCCFSCVCGRLTGIGWLLHPTVGRTQTDRVVPRRSGGGGLRPLPQWLVGRPDLRLPRRSG
jgi:hypothetical protein